MDGPKRRFCSIESSEDPAANTALNSPQKILASALERHNIPYELVVNRLDRMDFPADPNSCDLCPEGIAPLRVFVYEFLTTDPHYQRACSVVSKILPNRDSALDE